MILRAAPAAVILILCRYLLQEQICLCEAAFLSTSDEAVPCDEDSEKCPICLHTFSTHEVGIPDTCNHTFYAVSNIGKRMLIPVQ
jgi:hypothetical protein